LIYLLPDQCGISFFEDHLTRIVPSFDVPGIGVCTLFFSGYLTIPAFPEFCGAENQFSPAIINPEKFHSKAHYSPFDGFKVKGMPVMTILRGNIVMDQGKILESHGKYIYC
jgi:hypothetical protein